MKRRNFNFLAAASSAALGAGIGFPRRAMAGVSQAQADQLKTTLTPMGSQKEGNADGTIPPWTGGYTEIPAGWQSPALMPDMFANEQPLMTINSSNMAQYADKLPDSVKILMQQRGYSINVYPTHRTHALPQWVYDFTYQNALNAQAVAGGPRLGFTGAFGGVPFPILDPDPTIAGAQVLQNHNFRWQGSHTHYNNSTYAMSHGQLTLVLDDDFGQIIPYYDPKGSAATFDGIFSKGFYNPIAPANQIGANIIVYDSTNSLVFPDSGWELLTGQGRVRRIPEIQYDVPDSSVDGIVTYDEAFAFLGAEDDFDWKLVGKKEIYVPYNNNRVNFTQVSDYYPHFLNPAVVRWELHRCWVVEATLHPGKRNILPHRRFFVDEDTWTVMVTDEYDSNGNFWRSSQIYNCVRPDLPGTVQQSYATLDFQGDSYITSFSPQLNLPASQRTQDYVNIPEASMFNPQDMAARASF
jgi:hypothetical protein